MSHPLPATMIAAFCGAPGAALELREVALPVPPQHRTRRAGSARRAGRIAYCTLHPALPSGP